MKQHPTYNNILVDKNGSIYTTGKNYKSPKLLTPIVDSRGYHRVNVQVDLYEQRKKSIHRLVAETYLPNPYNFSDVHHKDNNPANNNLSNLEWLSHKNNIIKSRGNIGQNKASKWKLLNVKTNETFTIDNMSKWCEENNIDRANLHRTLKNYNQCKGYKVLEKLS